MQVKDIMQTEPLTVAPHMALQDVARLFVEERMSAAFVTSPAGRLVGIITEGDLLKQEKTLSKPLYLMFLDSAIPLNFKKFNQEVADMLATEVQELMTTEIDSLLPSADIREAVDVMMAKNIKQIPILDEEKKLLGAVTRRDIIRSAYGLEQNGD